MPSLGEMGLALFLVHPEIAIDRVTVGFLRLGGATQLRHDDIDALVKLGAFFGRAGDDKRRTRLVDEDAVHFVDDGESQTTLDAIFEAEGEVVA